MVGIKILKEATPLGEELQTTKLRIRELKRLIKIASEEDLDSSFGLRVQREVTEPLTNIFDAYGFLAEQMVDYEYVTVETIYGPQKMMAPRKPNKKGLKLLNYKIEESTLILILSALIKEEERKKEKIEKKLKELGFTIK